MEQEVFEHFDIIPKDTDTVYEVFEKVTEKSKKQDSWKDFPVEDEK